MAHKVALDAVKNLNAGRVRIIIMSDNEFSEVETAKWHIKFFAKHLSIMKGNYDRGSPVFSFDIEDKNYMTSNHKSKINYWVPQDDGGKREKAIMTFIEEMMSDVKITPRFSLSEHIA